MLGGLPRKAYQLNRARQENPALLALDAGALLFKKAAHNPENMAQELAAARGIAAAYQAMAYDAVGINALDLAGGLDFLREIASDGPPTWLSADLIEPGSGKLLFPPGLILERGGWRIGVIALTGEIPPPAALAPEDASSRRIQAEKVALRPWREALFAAEAEFAPETDMLILLSGLSLEENKLIAEHHPQIHLIMMGGQNSEANFYPILVNNSLLTATGRQGKRLGLLRINWSPDKIWFDHDLARLEELRGRLDSLNWQWRNLKRSRQLNESGSPAVTDLEQQRRTAQHEQKLKDEIGEVGEKITVLTGRADHRQVAGYDSSFVALDRSQPEDQAILKLVEATIRGINEIGRFMAGDQRGQNEGRQDSPYLGWPACAQCHQPQTEYWQGTGHAQAYVTLEKRQRQYDLNCLSCHVTGTYPDSDVRLLSLPASLRGVGCETCHGAGRDHAALMGSPDRHPAADSADRKINRRPEPALCLRCHTPDQSPNFSYQPMIERLKCPSS